MEFLYEYGLFIAKAITIVAAILLALGGIISLVSKQKQGKGHLEISSLSDKLESITEFARSELLSDYELKQFHKEQKKTLKAKKKAQKNNDTDAPDNGQLFVIDFTGSMDAHAIRLAVLMMRQLISPRLAINNLVNMVYSVILLSSWLGVSVKTH